MTETVTLTAEEYRRWARWTRWSRAAVVMSAIAVVTTGIGTTAVFAGWRNEDCRRRAETREDLRGVLLVVIDAIEEGTGPNLIIDDARQALDDNYPPLNAANC